MQLWHQSMALQFPCCGSLRTSGVSLRKLFMIRSLFASWMVGRGKREEEGGDKEGERSLNLCLSIYKKRTASVLHCSTEVF